MGDSAVARMSFSHVGKSVNANDPAFACFVGVCSCGVAADGSAFAIAGDTVPVLAFGDGVRPSFSSANTLVGTVLK